MKEDRGAGGRLQPQEGALQVDPMPRDGRSGEVYSPRALVPRQWRVGCTCVHLRKGRGSDRRMMHITVCRPDRDGRDGGGALHAKGGGSKSHICNKNNGSRGGEKDDTGVAYPADGGVPVMPGWLVRSGGALAQNAQRCVHAESQEKEGREGGGEEASTPRCSQRWMSIGWGSNQERGADRDREKTAGR